jgi:hypothetical protein
MKMYDIDGYDYKSGKRVSYGFGMGRSLQSVFENYTLKKWVGEVKIHDEQIEFTRRTIRFGKIRMVIKETKFEES